MDYKLRLKDYLSTCSGKVINVFYEIYQIINSVDETSQPDAIMYFLESLSTIRTDNSHRVTKEYYTELQVERIHQKFIKKKLHDFIHEQAEFASQEDIRPIDFYRNIWAKIKTSFCRTDKERALALFALASDKLVPYRNVGKGISMSDDEYEEAVDEISNSVFKETRYILNMHFEQKTQSASLLLDQLLSLENKELQTVYMTMLIDAIEDNIKDRVREYMEDM